MTIKQALQIIVLAIIVLSAISVYLVYRQIPILEAIAALGGVTLANRK